MKLIAHRGLMDGPNKATENDPYQISRALSEGFDAEIDLWYVDKQLLLGHDEPVYPVDFLWISKNQHHLWVHAKNFEALNFLTEFGDNFFWHENDRFTITTCGWIWTYPDQPLGPNSICVMPEQYMNINNVGKLNCEGICSDYIREIKKTLEE